MKTITELEVNGRTITCYVRRKDIRHVYLRLKPDFRLEISLPRNKEITADSITENKRLWIEKKVEELSRVRKIFNGDYILYHGEYIKVKTCSAEKPYKGVRLYNKVILISEDHREKRDQILADFITNQTLKYVQQKAVEFARDLGVTYKNISTKETRRWGYCTRDGKIVFNWRLICLPVDLVDYIVFHELLHLKHFNHSKQFRNAMAKRFADHKELSAMLRTYVLA